MHVCVCVCVCVCERLRSGVCVLKAYDAGLWVLDAGLGRPPGEGGGGRREASAGSSSAEPRLGGGGGLPSSTQERLGVCADLVFLVVLLVVHAGPGRLVLHALQTLVQGLQRQLSVRGQRQRDTEIRETEIRETERQTDRER